MRKPYPGKATKQFQKKADRVGLVAMRLYEVEVVLPNDANALGFILVSQVNRHLVVGRGPRKVLGWGVSILAIAAALLLACTLTGAGGFAAVFTLLFFVVASLGLIASNVSAVAMAPFGDRAGAAASLLGFSQAMTGVLASAAIGWIHARGAVPMAAVVACCAAVSLLSYLSLVRIERASS